MLRNLSSISTIGRGTLLLVTILLASVLLVGCADGGGNNGNDGNNGNGGNNGTPAAIIDTTAPAAVSNVSATPLPSGTEILLQWTDSISDDVTSITISWSSTVDGILEGSTTAEVGTEQNTIGSLVPITPYTFVITVADATGNSTAATTAPVNTLPNSIDADENGLIDINSLERLYNMHYNLDVSATGDDGRYKESTQIGDGEGILCGADAATPCTGYELTRNLDFANSNSYASGEINTAWRPTGGNPATATNAGWQPIGSCNADTTDGGTAVCNDNDDTPFAARFEGNGYTISNLYARNTNDSTAAAIGLFAVIDSAAAIDTVGIVNASVYGSGATIEYIGGLVGNSEGSISASYAIDSTADGGAGNNDRVGGLVGQNDGSISASYTTDSTADGGMGDNDRVGGLVGRNSGSITASYTSDSTADGCMGTGDSVGGLVGVHLIGDSIIASYAHNSTADGGHGDTDNVGGLVGSGGGIIIASYASDSTADGGIGNGDRVGGLRGFNGGGGIIIASYASGNMANGGAGDDDAVGGLMGFNSNGTIIASYASDSTANGGADNNDIVGGLVGDNSTVGTITGSYATATADGGTGSGDTVGSLAGLNNNTNFGISGTITASYGFGSTANVDTAGLSQGPDGRPTDDTVDSTSGSTGAAFLLAPNPSDSTNTSVAATWNQSSSNTAGAWDFGNTSQIPALRYADYDGADDTYGCGSDSGATIVIPDSVPDGNGGTIDIECGTTLLPGQGR